MKNIQLFLVSLLTSVIINCYAGENKSVIKNNFSEITSIDISTVSGNCTVKSYDGDSVKVILEYNYKPAKSFTQVFNKEGEKLILKEKMTGSNSGWSNWILIVPEKMDISFSSASGSLEIKDVSGSIKVSTASGNILLEDLKILDQVKLSSASGNIEVSFAESPEFDFKASSASGDATIDFNGNPVKGTIEMKARVKNGEIRCPFKFDTEEIIGDDQKYMLKKVVLESETPEIQIHTASGKAILKK